MQNLFFLGIILLGKEKIPNKSTKTIQKQNKKKIKASHFAVETVGRSMEGKGRGAAGRPPKGKGRPGPRLQPAVKQGRGQVSSAVESAEKQKYEHMRSPQAPQTVSAKCAQEPQRFQ